MKESAEDNRFSLKVLHIINSLDTGGAEGTLTHYLIEAKKTFNKKMDVAVYRNTSVYSKQLQQNGIYVINLGIKRKYSILAIWKTISLIKKGKYQIVFVQLFPTSLYVALASLFLPDVIFLLRETTTKTRRRKYPLLKIMDKFIYSRFKIIACVDEMVEQALIKWMKCVKGKTRIIGKGIPLPHKTRKTVKKYDIAFVGRLVQAKGIDILLSAIASIKSRQSVKNVIIVGDGPLMPLLKERAKILNIIDTVNFLGERNDVVQLLQASRIFALPSLWEGTPSALLEAMALKLPVVATRVGGIPNIIIDNVDGLLVPSNDADSLASAIEKMLSSPDLMKTMGSSAYQKVKQHYSINTYTRNVLALLNTVKMHNSIPKHSQAL